MPARARWPRNWAEAARDQFQADLGLGIGHVPADPLDPHGEPAKVTYALATAEGVHFGATRLFGPSDLHRPRVSKAALDLARKYLLGIL